MRLLLPYCLILVLLSLLPSCGDDVVSDAGRPLAEIVRQITPNETLEGVEPRITAAMTRSFLRKDPGPLDKLRSSIVAVKGEEYHRLVGYWSAFVDFQLAVFHDNHEAPDESKTAINRGIATLEAVEGKNVEELNLLAFLQGFSTQFADEAEQIRISDRAQANVSAAMKLNPDNLRTQYVTGCLDFYTPAEYGGQQVAKIHLTKATELPANAIDSPYLPTWGKAEAYELLVRYYSAQGEVEIARQTLDEGLALYPDDHQLSELVSQSK